MQQIIIVRLLFATAYVMMLVGNTNRHGVHNVNVLDFTKRAPGRKPKMILLSLQERRDLQEIIDDPEVDEINPTEDYYRRIRAHIILLAGNGMNNRQIALELHITDASASQWRNHWLYYPMLRPFDRLSNFSPDIRAKTFIDPEPEPDAEVIKSNGFPISFATTDNNDAKPS